MCNILCAPGKFKFSKCCSSAASCSARANPPICNIRWITNPPRSIIIVRPYYMYHSIVCTEYRIRRRTWVIGTGCYRVGHGSTDAAMRDTISRYLLKLPTDHKKKLYIYETLFFRQKFGFTILCITRRKFGILHDFSGEFIAPAHRQAS